MNFAIFSESFIERAGIINFLNDLFPGMTFIEADNFENLQQICKKNKIDYILILENRHILQNIRESISTLYENSEQQCMLILEDFVAEKHKILLETGINISIMLKLSTEDEFRAAFKTIISGNRYICSQVSNVLLNKHVPKSLKQGKSNLLTVTENEILKEITLGKTTKEIAAKRNVSIHTVMTHRKNIFRKIEVNTVYEATKYAMRAGIVELAEYYI